VNNKEDVTIAFRVDIEVVGDPGAEESYA